MVRVSPSGGVDSRTVGHPPAATTTAFGVAFNGFNSKIVLTGFTRTHPGVTYNHFATVSLQRGAPVPDPEFNGTGRASVDFGTGAVASGVAIDSLLRIVQVGIVERRAPETTTSRSLASAPADGAFDTGFSRTASRRPTSAGSIRRNAVAIHAERPDRGRRVRRARVRRPTSRSPATTRSTARSTIPASGRTATARRTSGAARTSRTGSPLQADGKIVVAGDDAMTRTSRSPATTPTARSTRPSRGDGKQTNELRRRAATSPPAWRSRPTARSSSAGHAFTRHASNDFALARYNPDGSLDTSFSGDGKQTTDFGSNDLADGDRAPVRRQDRARQATQEPDALSGKFAIARYEGGGRRADGRGRSERPVAARRPPPDPFPPPRSPPGRRLMNDVFTGSPRQRNRFPRRPRATTGSPAARSPTCCAARPATTRSTASPAPTTSSATSAPARSSTALARAAAAGQGNDAFRRRPMHRRA